AFLIARWLLLLLLAAGVYFLKGFLVPVLAALIIGLAGSPSYKRLVVRCNGRTALAATLAWLGVIVVLVVPSSLALSFAIQEASSFMTWALAANRYGTPAPEWIKAWPLMGERLTEYWEVYLGEPRGLGELVEMVRGQHVGNIYRM